MSLPLSKTDAGASTAGAAEPDARPATPEGTAADAIPGQGHLGEAIARFDERVEGYFDGLRANDTANQIFTLASRLGDFSLIWHLANLGRGARRGRADQTVAVAVALGIESLLVNQGIKRLVRRQRPTVDGDARTRVRRPSSSSFPSGHASSAVFNAVLATALDHGPGRLRRALVWWTLAAVVATSRIHVRIHHPSDVVGGAVVGAVTGAIAARIIRRILAGPNS